MAGHGGGAGGHGAGAGGAGAGGAGAGGTGAGGEGGSCGPTTTYYANDFDAGTTGLGFPDQPNYWARMTSGGVNDSAHMRLTYDTNLGTSGNQMTLDVTPYAINEFWVRFGYRIIGTANGGSKFFKMFGLGGNNMTLIMDYGAGEQKRVIYYGDTLCEMFYSGTPSGGNSAECVLPTWLTTSSADAVVQDAEWHVFKAYVQRASRGQSDGAVRVFSDGVELAHLTGMNSNPDDVDSTVFDYFSWGDYTNPGTHVAAWSLDVDDIVIADADPDGCG